MKRLDVPLVARFIDLWVSDFGLHVVVLKHLLSDVTHLGGKYETNSYDVIQLASYTLDRKVDRLHMHYDTYGRGNRL